MPFLAAQSATNYLTLLDEIETFLTNRASVSMTVTVNAGGTGYVVGDVLTLSGGTQSSLSVPIQLVVTSETGGVIDAGGVRVSQSGSYTADPTFPAGHTGGTGTAATFTLTMGDVGWTRRRRSQEAVSATVSAGGSGYTIGDDLTVVGGVDVKTAAVFNVDSEGAASADSIAAAGTGYTNGAQTLTLTGGTFSTAATVDVTVAGGVVTAIVGINVAGDYTVTPTDPVSTSGGGGTGATLNMTFGAAAAVSLVTAGDYGETPSNPAATTSTPGTGATLTVTYQDLAITSDFDLILDGEGSGADSIIVGFRTFPSGAARNWELSGMTAYSAATPFRNHPGISPGRWDETGTPGHGAYVPLDGSTITYWIFANGRRIIGVFKVGSGTYTSMHLGWLNPFGTSTDFPYPLMIIGCSSIPSTLFSSTVIGYRGMLDPVSALGSSTGPGLYRDPGGLWNSIRNSNESGAGVRSQRDEFVIWPAGSPGVGTISDEDRFSNDANVSTDLIPSSGNPGTPDVTVLQTPDTPDDISLLWPTAVIREGGGGIPRDVHGELDNVFWTSANISGQSLVAVSEDVFDDGTDRYLIFQNCNQTDLWTYFCVKEE